MATAAASQQSQGLVVKREDILEELEDDEALLEDHAVGDAQGGVKLEVKAEIETVEGPSAVERHEDGTKPTPVNDYLGYGAHFDCDKCEFNCNRFKEFAKHYVKLHSRQAKGKLKLKLARPSSKMHQCQWCKKWLLQDCYVLSCHMETHKALGGWRKYKLEVEPKEEKGTLRMTLGDWRKKQDIDNMKALRKFGLPNPEQCPKTDKVGNFCRFKCHCGFEADSIWKLGMHHRPQHGRFELNRSMISSVTVHNCRLCNMLLLADRHFIFDHLRTCHKMSMSQYVPDLLRSNPNKFDDLEGPITAKTRNLCKFFCIVCGHISISWCALARHLNKEHNAGLSVKPAFEPAYLVRTVRHRCQICHRLMLCDIGFINSHVNCNHHMKIKDYAPDYYKIRLKFLKSLYVKGRNSLVFHQNLKGRVTMRYGQFCRFQCPHCREEMPSRRRLQLHCISVHGSAKLKFDQKLMSRLVLHQCSLCDYQTLADFFYVGQHVRVTHKIGMDKYKKLVSRRLAETGYNSDDDLGPPSHRSRAGVCFKKDFDQAPFRCDRCDFQCTSIHGYHGHRKKKHAQSGKTFGFLVQNASPDSQMYQCRVCKLMVLQNRTAIMRHLKGSHDLNQSQYHKLFPDEPRTSGVKLKEWRVAEFPMASAAGLGKARRFAYKHGFGNWSGEVCDDVADRCRFSCTRCKRAGPFPTWLSLIRHLHREHKVPTVSFERGMLSGEPVMHRCRVCASLILCDTARIRDHLTAHKTPRINMTKYLTLPIQTRRLDDGPSSCVVIKPVCFVCGFVSENWSEVIEHQKSVHHLHC